MLQALTPATMVLQLVSPAPKVVSVLLHLKAPQHVITVNSHHKDLAVLWIVTPVPNPATTVLVERKPDAM